jgi:hypothetical protein
VPSSLKLACRRYHRLKDSAGRPVLIDRSFGVPLHSDDEVTGRSSLQGLNNAVGRAASHDTQSFADRVGGLVMRRIHRHNDIVAARC